MPCVRGQLAASLALALIVTACGGDPPIIPDAGPPTLFPLAVGNQWTYRVTDDSGVSSQKVQRVLGTATVDGKDGFMIETARADGRFTTSVQLVVDNRLLRASEAELLEDRSIRAQFEYEPPALRVDSNFLTTGDRYEDMHTKTEVDETGAVVNTEVRTTVFEVEDAADVIEVPAGSIECVRIRRTRTTNGSVTTEKLFWFSEGLGKVRELGGQTEELESFELAP